MKFKKNIYIYITDTRENQQNVTHQRQETFPRARRLKGNNGPPRQPSEPEDTHTHLHPLAANTRLTRLHPVSLSLSLSPSASPIPPSSSSPPLNPRLLLLSLSQPDAVAVFVAMMLEEREKYICASAVLRNEFN